jgi:SAM-dependent methyltransferase
MSTPYRVLYRVGKTPWDGKGDLSPLVDLIDQQPPGSALDLGCGTGHHSVLLAEHGWQVTGIDAVPRALTAARARAAAITDAGQTVEFVRGDVTKLETAIAPKNYDLILDVGCLHGLTEKQRMTVMRSLTIFSGTGSMLLILAVAPRKGIGPKGFDRAGMLRYAASEWDLVQTTDQAAVNPASPLGSTPFTWYLLRRR